MAHLIDISASFDNSGAEATAENVTALFSQAKSSDDQPLLEVIHCSVLPDLDAGSQEAYAVVRARSSRFDANSLKPWLKKLIGDTKDGAPTLTSIDVLEAST